MQELPSLVEYFKNNELTVQTTITGSFEPTNYEQYNYPTITHRDYGKTVWCLVGPLEGLPEEYHNLQNVVIDKNIRIARQYTYDTVALDGFWGFPSETLGNKIFFYSEDSYDIERMIYKHKIRLNISKYQSDLYWILDSFFTSI